MMKRGLTNRGSKNGVSCGIKSTYGPARPITAVLVASTAGRIANPFFINQGKRMNSDCSFP